MIRLLENPNSSKVTLAVACYDLGEFCRFVPHSKIILETSYSDSDMKENRGKASGKTGKELLMDMINYGDKSVKEQALLATQKMMIHNWQSVKA